LFLPEQGEPLVMKIARTVYGTCMTTEQRSALESAITVDSRVLHGTPCFRDSRVPVQTLLDFLETGETVDAFLGGLSVDPARAGGHIP